MFVRKLAIAAMAAMLVGMASAGTASATLPSYADPAIEVHVNPTTLVGGNSFDGYATSNGFDCNWTVTFRGETQTDFGDRIDFTFDTPEVSETIDRDLVVTCSYDDTSLESFESPTDPTGAQHANYVVGNDTSIALPAAIQELERTVVITILPRSSDDDDDDDDESDGDGGGKSNHGLPDTGGGDVGWIYGGAALLLVGSVAIVASRRRETTNG